MKKEFPKLCKFNFHPFLIRSKALYFQKIYLTCPARLLQVTPAVYPQNCSTDFFLSLCYDFNFSIRTIYLSIYLSGFVCPVNCVCLSVCLPVCLSVCLSVHESKFSPLSRFPSCPLPT